MGNRRILQGSLKGIKGVTGPFIHSC
jgi:hypothetical protein